MKRIGLFIATNLGILAVLSVTLNLIEPVLAQRGIYFNGQGILVLALVFGMGGSFISLAMSKWMAKRLPGMQILERPRTPDEVWLLDTVRRFAKAAGIGMPDVGIYESEDVNAFATGMSRNKSLVAVSTGLLRRMDREQAEAVIGHEVTHVANGDMVTLALIQGVVNTFVIVLSRVVGQFVDKVILKNERGQGPGFWVTVIVAELVLGLLASIIVMWFSRQREFRADAGGARLAGRHNMISALERLKQPAAAEALPDQMEAFGISGRVGQGLSRLFMSHPPLDERIDALKRAKLD